MGYFQQDQQGFTASFSTPIAKPSTGSFLSGVASGISDMAQSKARANAAELAAHKGLSEDDLSYLSTYTERQQAISDQLAQGAIRGGVQEATLRSTVQQAFVKNRPYLDSNIADITTRFGQGANPANVIESVAGAPDKFVADNTQVIDTTLKATKGLSDEELGNLDPMVKYHMYTDITSQDEIKKRKLADQDYLVKTMANDETIATYKTKQLVEQFTDDVHKSITGVTNAVNMAAAGDLDSAKGVMLSSVFGLGENGLPKVTPANYKDYVAGKLGPVNAPFDLKLLQDVMDAGDVDTFTQAANTLTTQAIQNRAALVAAEPVYNANGDIIPVDHVAIQAQIEAASKGPLASLSGAGAAEVYTNYKKVSDIRSWNRFVVDHPWAIDLSNLTKAAGEQYTSYSLSAAAPAGTQTVINKILTDMFYDAGQPAPSGDPDDTKQKMDDAKSTGDASLGAVTTTAKNPNTSVSEQAHTASAANGGVDKNKVITRAIEVQKEGFTNEAAGRSNEGSKTAVTSLRNTVARAANPNHVNEVVAGYQTKDYNTTFSIFADPNLIKVFAGDNNFFVGASNMLDAFVANSVTITRLPIQEAIMPSGARAVGTAAYNELDKVFNGGRGYNISNDLTKYFQYNVDADGNFKVTLDPAAVNLKGGRELQSRVDNLNRNLAPWASAVKNVGTSSGLFDPMAAFVKAGEAWGMSPGRVVASPALKAKQATAAGPEDVQLAVKAQKLGPLPASVDQAVVAAAQEAKIPENYLRNMIAQESSNGYDKHVWEQTGLDGKSAYGYTQVHLDAVADVNKEYGLKLDPRSHEDNVRIGALYMALLRDKYGLTLPETALAYNWGIGNFKKWKAGNGPENPPEGAKSYVVALTSKPFDIKPEKRKDSQLAGK